MQRRKAEFLVDFQKVKSNKQQVLQNTFADLYDWMFTFIQSEANLREKVRAKHLFCHKIGLSNKEELDPSMQVHFEHWLLFDYVTVVGSRLFDIFVRTKQNEMTKQMLELCGILMLMHFVPVRICEVKKEHVKMFSLFDEKEIEVSPYLFEPDVNKNDLAFMRLSMIGFEKKIIGPTIVIDPSFEQKIIKELTNVYKQGQPEYRRYLKEYGIDMLKYGKIHDGRK
ncbi:hypothetical protein [Salipaludibacillus daqingensis]|uniref:hypothetical protein n=1 Tax=Salipaludibacillus daqingensis TaxID=3041001 RepID=UPI0024747A85|nr:hypothetical protein [Salipaludibacillus daqingensis]